ncbi:O-antigen ligase family protein [Clostridium sp. A1-XYC3]|uniref:O-antigen ligase family protein n=1 Tax=Clostridium tanneri TaxID=3037988 RepID=A0ABU4JXC7_9CLOT|nr:O-antigen ligase family protein [Clostridium sp. A1-XYC3]MDW8802596.1 O-antigen ligase family protein [Clostridium sp. A1-XYC3]
MKLSILFMLILIPLTDVKLYGIKLSESFFIILFLSESIKYLSGRSKKKCLDMEFNIYIKSLFLVFVLFFIFSILSFASSFYIPSNLTGFIYKPVVISISRFIQLFICAFMVLFLYNSIENRNQFTMLLAMYVRIGVLICIYSLICYILNKYFGFELRGAYISGNEFRLRGTFVEGGPFGNYIISVIYILYLYTNLTKKQRFVKYLSYSILFVCLILAKSKAALILMILTIAAATLLLNLNINKRNKTKKSNLVVVLMFLIIVFLNRNMIFNGISNYYQSYKNAKYEAYMHIEDGNFVYGRIAGSHIVPNMIRNKPIIGVGLGNYPIVRNDPTYRVYFPEVLGLDYSGLGILETAAEVGIPLSIILIIIMSRIIIYIKTYKLPIYIISIGLFQVLVHICGTQITFIYPYFSTCVFYLYLKLRKRNIL